MMVIMMSKRYKLKDKDILEHDKKLTIEQVVKQLNDYEDNRLRRKQEIEKFRAREERYQRIIGGIKAYFELEANIDLWWNWND